MPSFFSLGGQPGLPRSSMIIKIKKSGTGGRNPPPHVVPVNDRSLMCGCGALHNSSSSIKCPAQQNAKCILLLADHIIVKMACSHAMWTPPCCWVCKHTEQRANGSTHFITVAYGGKCGFIPILVPVACRSPILRPRPCNSHRPCAKCMQWLVP